MDVRNSAVGVALGMWVSQRYLSDPGTVTRYAKLLASSAVTEKCS